MALTKVGGDIIRQPLDIGSLNATTVQIGAATTVHTTGIDVGSGSVTGHNIHSTGIVTATSFVGPVTGNVTGNLTGNVTGNADTASNLTGSPSITVTNITAAGNVSIAGTLTYEDVTNIDAVGIGTFRNGLHITGGSIGIGTVSPSGPVHAHTASGTQRSYFEASAAHSFLRLKSGSTSYNSGVEFFSGASNIANVNALGAGDLQFEVNGTERLRIDSSGRLNIGSFSAPGFVGGFSHINVHGTGINANGAIGLYRNSASPSAGQGIGAIYFANSDGNPGAYIQGQSDGTWGTNDYPGRLVFFTTSDGASSATERLRITSGGNVGVNCTPLSQFQVKTATNANIALSADSSEASIEAYNDAGSANVPLRIRGSEIKFKIDGTQRARLYYSSNSAVLALGDESNSAGHIRLEAKASENQIHGRSNHPITFLINTGEKLKLHTSGLLEGKGAQFTANITPSSGRGVEIFEASTGVGQIQSYNRTGGSWDELKLKGSEVRIHTGSNALTLDLQSAASTLYGTSDGIFNLDTTDGRGSFIRFKENGTSKGWAGCSEGLGTGGDQDDFGIRAVGGFRLRTGTNNSIEITDEGQIALRPLTGGFTTQGAQHTYPGAAVSIQCHGIGNGTGTNIPQYGLYVDGAFSSNDATLMTGIFATSKQNTAGSAVGIHGLYKEDWNSYSRKIGGLFQAPARAPRYANRSFNPGGGIFANTTSTGFANRLAVGAARPDGNTSGNTYGDATALWGDCFRSDTDTSNDFCDSIAIKATNRVTHGRGRVGLMVGTVDGNDTSHNRRRVQAVEYYTEDTHQRFYNRNHKKEMNHHEPLFMSTTDGSRNTMNNVWTADYYVQKYQGTNQYSWYFYNTMSSSYARNGRLKFNIVWTTGHASGVGEAEYSVAYTVPHSGGTILMRRCTRFHQWSIGGSYYGWNWNPDVSFFHSTSTGNDAGIYLRLAGAQSPFDGYVVQSIKLEALECNYGFSTEASFRWVSHSTPSDAAANPESIHPPYTS